MKNTKQGRSFFMIVNTMIFSPFLRRIGVFLLCFFILVGCTKVIEGNPMIVQNQTVFSDTIFPVVWVKGDPGLFQPLYPNKTPLPPNAVVQDRVYLDNEGIELMYRSDKKLEINYRYITMSGRELVTGALDSELTEVSTDGFKELLTVESSKEASKKAENNYDIKVPSVEGLELGGSYLLELQMIKDETLGYVYLPVIFSDKSMNDAMIAKASEYLDSYLIKNSESLMGVKRISIHAESEATSKVNISYTAAIRLNGAFEYYDKKLVYQWEKSTKELVLQNEFKTSKQRYVYYDAIKGWDIGKYIKDNEISDQRQILTSQNNRYTAIFNDREIVLYDAENETMSEVYKLDRLDSDYVIDEYYHHALRIYGVNNNGEVFFSVYGYINDSMVYNQMTGVGIYYYHDHSLEVVSYMEKAMSLQQLGSFVNDSIYFDEDREFFYVFDNAMLYSIDGTSGKSEYIESFIEGNLDAKNGIIYWANQDTKYNQSINFINLNQRDLRITNLYTTGTYKHLLAIDQQGIIVGGYRVEDTYEQLDGRIVFLYHEMLIYNFDGELIKKYESDVAAQQYFGDAYFDEASDSFESDLLKIKYNTSSNVKNSRISFENTGERLSLLQSGDDTHAAKAIAAFVTDSIISVKALKHLETQFMEKLTSYERQVRALNEYILPLKTFYTVEDAAGNQYFATDYLKALLIGKDKTAYTISKIFYSEQEKWTQQLLFDSKSLKSEIQLENIKIIPQRPELPRGCEVTSLAILLDYYLEESPDKMTLASKIKKSTQAYRIENGFVQFSNMHEEFAGSMDNLNQEGLGVYIEPVIDLADQYLPNQIVNISGSSFKQVLTFVSMNRPVLVIIPNRYEAVPDYSIEVWNTPSGYIEVSYQEHSVVIMGFDESYVYYSDPSKGIIDKKPKNSFEEAWMSMGAQAMMVQKINE